MRRLLTILAFLVTGVGLGFLSAAAMINGGPGTPIIASGPWVAWPKAGSVQADPYTKAHFAMTGELPLTASEVVIFHSETDDDANGLSGDCTYRISGRQLPARLWTLTVYASGGKLIDNPADRHSFNSRNVLRNSDGSFQIAVAPEPQPGNWIPTGNANRLTVLLRLFNVDSTVSNRLGEIPLPGIERLRCS